MLLRWEFPPGLTSLPDWPGRILCLPLVPPDQAGHDASRRADVPRRELATTVLIIDWPGTSNAT